MAMTIEYPAGLDDQARCVDFTGDYSLGLNLYSSLGEDNPIKTARNSYVIAFNLPLHPSLFSQD